MKLSRRDFIHAGCAAGATSLTPNAAVAWIHGSVATAPGSLLSLTAADTTPIDPQAGVGASGSGWVAIATLKGLTSLTGTAVPSALTLSASDPGFDISGNVTTVACTITGVAHLRRQYPNGNSKMISTDGANYIRLDDWIYSGTTIVSGSIGSTFYPGCTANNAASATFSFTSQRCARATISTLARRSPSKPASILNLERSGPSASILRLKLQTARIRTRAQHPGQTEASCDASLFWYL